MPRRGIIEGFYGKPWSLEQELDAIWQLWEHKMNTHIYNPKDDPYHRDLWRKPYPHEHLSTLLRLLKECQKYQIDFYYMLSPGLSMEYSSDKEFEALTAKYRQMYGLGIKHLGLLLDDIPEELLYESDKAKYEYYGDAHNDICRKAYTALKEMDSGISFTVCPTIYRGSSKQDYIVSMGKAMPEDASIFWTGPKTCAFDLSAAHTREFIENTSHRPFYWDNYPVNDAKMVVEMHLAPIANRDYELVTLSDGIVANTMEHKEASMLSVISFAHFMWAPNRNAMRLADYPEMVEQRIRNEVEKIAPFAGDGNILLMNGYDQEMEPDDILPYIRDGKADFGTYTIQQSTPDNYMAALAKGMKDAQELSGALYSGRYISVFPGILSSRMYVKQQNHCQKTAPIPSDGG